MSTGATTLREDFLVSRNPATGVEIGRVASTPPEEIEEMVSRARRAQASWASKGWRDRRKVLESWWRQISREADDWADLIRSEIGKPRIEAMGGDVIPTLDTIRWTIKHGGATLAGHRIGPSWQRWMMMPGGVADGYRSV